MIGGLVGWWDCGKNEDGWLMVILVCGCCLGSHVLSPFLFSFSFLLKGNKPKRQFGLKMWK